MKGFEIVGIAGLACLAIIALTAAWWAVGGYIIMLAWNALLPYLLGAPTISWIQGVAAAVLITIIGGAFRSTVSYGNK